MSKEPMPQTGGSYTRDPVTGEPVLSEAPAKQLEPQPKPAAKPEKPSKE